LRWFSFWENQVNKRLSLVQNRKTNILTIKTPEGVAFSMPLAGPIPRLLAWMVDVLVILAANKILNIMLGLIGIISRDLAAAAIYIGFFLISIGYGIITEWYWQGQSLGKRILRIRVADVNGLRLRFSQIVIRNLLRFVDSLPVLYLVGGLACLISRRAQRLGDLAANTVVTWIPSIHEPDLNQLMEGKFNSFRKYPHLEARLRQRVSPQEAQIALQSLVRRDGFEPPARVELFSQIATHFKNMVEFPPEAIEGISDEQYVRNLVDALFRAKSPP
jgi:uncharacterized RDD family membrane protein YckC